MNTEPTLLHVIYLRSNGILVSKKQYSDWREIQDEYEDYMASLEFSSGQELIEFLRIDWKEDETKWPFSSSQIMTFMNSNEQILRQRLST